MANYIQCPECFRKEYERKLADGGKLPEEKCCGHGFSIGTKCVTCGALRKIGDMPWACQGGMSKGMSGRDGQ